MNNDQKAYILDTHRQLKMATQEPTPTIVFHTAGTTIPMESIDGLTAS